MKYLLLSVIALTANAEWYGGHEAPHYRHTDYHHDDHYSHRDHRMHDSHPWSHDDGHYSN